MYRVFRHIELLISCYLPNIRVTLTLHLFLQLKIYFFSSKIRRPIANVLTFKLYLIMRLVIFRKIFQDKCTFCFFSRRIWLIWIKSILENVFSNGSGLPLNSFPVCQIIIFCNIKLIFFFFLFFLLLRHRKQNNFCWCKFLKATWTFKVNLFVENVWVTSLLFDTYDQNF